MVDVLYWAGLAATFAGFAFLAHYFISDKAESWPHGCALYAAGWWLWFLSAVADGDIGQAVLDGLFASLWTWLWWKNRPRGRGRKALRELGDKSRQRVQELVDQMTPSPVPSPAGGRA